jgi:mycothiol synthase
LFGRGEATGYVQRLAIAPVAQGAGLGRAVLGDGLRWLAAQGATRALVNTQEDNVRAVDLYARVGFSRLPVGLCVLGRTL